MNEKTRKKLLKMAQELSDAGIQKVDGRRPKEPPENQARMLRISIHALTDEQGTDGGVYREMLKAADVVIGHDVDTQNEFIVYGRSVLERLAENGVPEKVNIIMVELDQDTPELEWLLAAVQVLKGRDDYIPSPESQS